MRDPIRICRGCGCDDNHACPGGCEWVLLDIETPSGICSACADEMDWDALFMRDYCSGHVAEILREGDRRGLIRA